MLPLVISKKKNYRPQQYLREGNVFTDVCHSVHREEVGMFEGVIPEGGGEYCRGEYVQRGVGYPIWG